MENSSETPQEIAFELEWLRWFYTYYETGLFDTVHMRQFLQQIYEAKTGNQVPEKYRLPPSRGSIWA